jgi:hypothetical protein
VQRWQMSRYTRALILGSAERWEGLWHRRARELDETVDPDELLGWLHDEAETWRLIDRVAQHHRHWRARIELIAQMRSASARLGFAELGAAVPPFDDRWIDEARATGVARGVADEEEVALRDVRWANERLDMLHELLADWLTNQLPASGASVRELGADGRVPSAAEMGALCAKHAAMWRRLREWMAPPLAPSSPDPAVDSAERAARTPPVPLAEPAVGAPAGGRGVLGQRRPPIRFGRGASSPPGR